MAKRKSSRARRKSKKGYSKLIALCAVAVVLVTAAVLLTVLPSRSPSPTQLAGTPSPTAGAVQTPSPDATETVQASPTPYEEPEILIQLMGDVLLHDTTTIRGGLQSDGTYDFSSYLDIISQSINGDLAIANIEAPVDANGDGSGISGYPRFNVPRAIVTALKNAGVNLALTANNHALDKGYTGLKNTIAALEAEGMDHYGTFTSQEEHDTYKIIDVKGIKVGLLAYTDSVNGLMSLIPEENQDYCINLIGLNSNSDLNRMEEDVKNIREQGAEFVIVSLHWGREYTNAPTERQRAIAQSLLDSGADVIMGNHSHCVQPITKKEIEFEGKTKTVVVAYSMGNFLADQMSLEKDENMTQHSFILNLNVKRAQDGTVYLADATYTPTFTHRDSVGSGVYAYKVLPAGKYANAQSRPDIFASDEKWALCKQAWERTQRIVGDMIEAREE